MRKNICALFVVLLILLMMGCAATTKDAVDVEIKNDSTEVSVDSENETTESSTTEKETVDENTDTPENTEDNKEESEQEPELSEEEKHAALLEKINTQQETCKMLNDMNMGNKYSCFYDESTNTFTYNMDVSGAADFVPSDAFNDLINSTDFSASSNHEYLGIDCYSNFLDGTIVLYSSLNGQRNDDLTLVRLSPDDTEPTFGQKNALSSAESYLAISAFSHSKLIQQLEYEGYSSEEATYDFGQNNDSLNRVNLIIQLSEDYDGTTEDALWTIMNFYYKNIGTSPDVNEGTASCIWKTGQSTIELFCTFASSGLFFITYLPLA